MGFFIGILVGTTLGALIMAFFQGATMGRSSQDAYMEGFLAGQKQQMEGYLEGQKNKK